MYATDDEIYRVDSVWLGPPNATFPWRARYIAWGIGIALFLGLFTLVREVFSLSFWSVAWTVVLTVALTRLVSKRINPERPFLQVALMAAKEIRSPRGPGARVGGSASARGVRIHPARPRATQPPLRNAHRAKEAYRA